MTDNQLHFEDNEGARDDWVWLRKRLVEAMHSYAVPSMAYVRHAPMIYTGDEENPAMLSVYPDLIEAQCLPYNEPFDMCTVDIGANVGAFTIIAAQFSRHVYAYEPCAETFERLKANVAHMSPHSRPVNYYRRAVGAKSNEVAYMKRSPHTSYSGDAQSWATVEEGEEYEEVMTISLEDVLAATPNQYIDYLKVDCEGAEYDFLLGKDLSRVGYVTIELHVPLDGDESKRQELLDHLSTTHACRVTIRPSDDQIEYIEGHNRQRLASCLGVTEVSNISHTAMDPDVHSVAVRQSFMNPQLRELFSALHEGTEKETTNEE